MNSTLVLGSLLNDAVQIKPSDNPAEPKAAHKTLAEHFWTQLSSNDESVVGELNKIMNFLLTQSKRELQLERAVWFVSFCFSELLRSNDELRQSSANSFLGILCDRTDCENKTVRFRSCQFLRTVLDNVPDGLELDEDIAEALYSILLSRCEDRSQDVRIQALFALDRFKTAGENEQYRECQVTQLYHQVLVRDPQPGPRSAALNCLPVTRKTIKALCERTRDESDLVRMTVFKVISWRIHPQQLGVDLAGRIVQNGYNDRSDLVIRLCQEIVLSWFMKHADQDFTIFFSFFNSKTQSEIFPKMMETLLQKKPVQVIQAAKKLLESKCVAQEDSTDGDMLMWKTILCTFNLQAEALGLKAADGTNNEASTQSDSLLKIVDLALPQTFKELGEFFWTLFLKEEHFQTGQLLEIIIQCCNFTELADKLLGGELYRQLCIHMDLKSKQLTIERVLAFGRCIYPDVHEFMYETMTVLEERKTELDEGQETTVPSWCHFAFALVQTLTPRIHNAMSLGTPDFTLQHIFEFFLSLLEQVSDSDGLKSTLIKGIGGILCLDLNEESREAYLSLFWNCFESSTSGVVIASLEIFSTLAMIYGIRKIDLVPDIVIPTSPYPELWSYDWSQPIHSDSLPCRIHSILGSNNGSRGTIQVAVVQSLCKLLTMNQFQSQYGMDIPECVQSLSLLIRFFSLPQDSDKHLSCIQQYLRIFFERFCRVRLLHQYLLRVSFLPVLYDSMSDSTNLKTPQLTAVVKVLANLMKVPVKVSSNDNTLQDKVDREITRMDSQLICLLLWELSQCPSNSASKTYIASIWKVILDFKIEGFEETQKAQILTILKHLQSEYDLQAKNTGIITTRLEGSDPQWNTRIEDQKFIETVCAYMERFGPHPLLEQ